MTTTKKTQTKRRKKKERKDAELFKETEPFAFTCSSTLSATQTVIIMSQRRLNGCTMFCNARCTLPGICRPISLACVTAGCRWFQRRKKIHQRRFIIWLFISCHPNWPLSSSLTRTCNQITIRNLLHFQSQREIPMSDTQAEIEPWVLCMIGSTGLECPMTWMTGLRDVHDVFAGRLQNFRDAFGRQH